MVLECMSNKATNIMKNNDLNQKSESIKIAVSCQYKTFSKINVKNKAFII